MTPHLWLWSAGPRCGLSDDPNRAREDAEEAAIDGDCPALLELVAVGLGDDLEPVYVHTAISFKGAVQGAGQPSCTPARCRHTGRRPGVRVCWTPAGLS